MSVAEADYGVITESGAIRFERLLPGPIDRVWDYLTVSDKRRLWLAAGDMELREGATAALVWRHSELASPGDAAPPQYAGQEHRAQWRVVRVEPPRLLVQDWEGTGEVTFELAERGDQVMLTVTHRRIPSRDTHVGVSAGWHTHLDLLRDTLSGARKQPFWARHGALKSEYGPRIPA